jgi:Zn-dependent protease with chaperone function
MTSNFTTKLRSGLLIAGLSGLLLAIGAVIGGGALYLFIAITVLFNVAMYWFSDKIALKMSRAQPVSEAEAPGLYQDIRELSGRAGIPMPRVCLIPHEQPNAFATGRDSIHERVKLAPMPVNPAAESLSIANPLSGRGMTSLFSTHPPVEERVRRLRALDVPLIGALT